MARITFVEADGTRVEADARSGQSLMEAAKANGVEGVIAECGGSMVCGTCHVYLPDAICAQLPQPSAMEADMLEWGIDVRPTSRLACQVAVTDALDGAIIGIPARQR